MSFIEVPNWSVRPVKTIVGHGIRIPGIEGFQATTVGFLGGLPFMSKDRHSVPRNALMEPLRILHGSAFAIFDHAEPAK